MYWRVLYSYFAKSESVLYYIFHIFCSLLLLSMGADLFDTWHALPLGSTVQLHRRLLEHPSVQDHTHTGPCGRERRGIARGDQQQQRQRVDDGRCAARARQRRPAHPQVARGGRAGPQHPAARAPRANALPALPRRPLGQRGRRRGRRLLAGLLDAAACCLVACALCCLCRCLRRQLRCEQVVLVLVGSADCTGISVESHARAVGQLDSALVGRVGPRIRLGAQYVRPAASAQRRAHERTRAAHVAQEQDLIWSHLILVIVIVHPYVVSIITQHMEDLLLNLINNSQRAVNFVSLILIRVSIFWSLYCPLSLLFQVSSLPQWWLYWLLQYTSTV